MNDNLENIKDALLSTDIEGLIEKGAPSDEYEAEAKEITSALVDISSAEWNERNITAVVAVVWQKHFALSEEDMKKRMPAFQSLAQKIVKL
jgi:hypothetical protein